MTERAVLVLEDGSVFRGQSVGASGVTTGEVVFNTAMTGYQEILTDPSYSRQIVTLTCPHIGNTGCNDEDAESAGVQAAGLIIRDLPVRISNWRSRYSLGEYLEREKTIAIAGIDTRRLTRILRDEGAQSGCLVAGDIDESDALERAKAFPGLSGMDLAREVTTAQPYVWDTLPWRHAQDGTLAPPAQKFRVIAYDFGIKRNILRLLAAQGCELTVVPATTGADEVLAERPDGVFLSNGPGDPEPCAYAVNAIRRLVESRVPVFGICLGHQLLALASGARTSKMKFGHHGANHPVQDLDTRQVYITSQNHGFAVDEDTLPTHLRATHRSLFDGTLQGIERTDCPAFGFQGHPEASPGPHDLRPLFERFSGMMLERRNA